MERCKNCKHFEFGELFNRKTGEPEHSDSRCNHPQLEQEGDFGELFGPVLPGPDFGCVLFEVKQNGS